jgi:hypothetical protein
MKRRLNEAKTVTLNFFGVGTADLGPSYYNEEWHVTNVALFVSSNAAEPTARIYVGDAVPSNQLGGTYNGSNDSTDVDVTLHPGQKITCRWGDANGDPGAKATLSVYGWQLIGETGAIS